MIDVTVLYDAESEVKRSHPQRDRINIFSWQFLLMNNMQRISSHFQNSLESI